MRKVPVYFATGEPIPDQYACEECGQVYTDADLQKLEGGTSTGLYVAGATMMFCGAIAAALWAFTLVVRLIPQAIDAMRPF